MRKTGLCLAAATLLLGGLAWTVPAGAQAAMHDNHTPPKPVAAPAAAPTTPTIASLRAGLMRQIGDAEKKLVALAEAMPAEKYGWRPGEGVRSVGEVYMHVASANYFFAMTCGAKLPEGVNPRELEKEGGDKAKTVAALKQSFDFINQNLAALPDADLSKPVKFFGNSPTVWDVMVIAATHPHEHLGQSIAYARTNGVVPPWSAAAGKKGGD